MFGHKKHEENLNTPSQEPQESDISQYSVHVMPEKFRLQGKESVKIVKEAGGSEKASFISGRERWVGMIIIGVAGAGVIVSAFFLYKTSFAPKKTPLAPQTSAVQDEKNSAKTNEEKASTAQESTSSASSVGANQESGSSSETVNQNVSAPDENASTSEANTPALVEDGNVNEAGEKVLQQMPLPMSADTDSDLLTDAEEMLYGTGAQNSDTDSDGYPDGQEVLNFYNPAQKNSTLLQAELMQTYSHASIGISMYYPSAWTVNQTNIDSGSVMFTSQTGEFIQILKEEKPKEKNLRDWYLSLYPPENGTSAASLEFESVSLAEGFEGMKSLDGLVAYITPISNPEIVYIISYNPGTKKELNFKTTFEMMLRSIQE